MERYWDHPAWEYIDPLPMDGLYRVCKDGKWGCVDETGTLVIPFRWQFIGHILEHLIFVQKGGFWGILRRDGTAALECRWNTICQDPEDPSMLVLTRGTEIRRISLRCLCAFPY